MYTHTIVIGCGVSGLTSGIRLLEAGYGVTIWARDLPPHTTSDIAGAIWYPFQAFPVERVGRWAARGYEEFARLARQPQTGVLLRRSIEIFPVAVDDPWWRELVPSFRRLTAGELPPDCRDGYEYAAAAIETPIYLRWLVDRFARLGGTIETRQVASFAEPFAQADVVVNCTGLGARELAGDASLYGAQGQTVEVAQVGIDSVTFDHYDVAQLKLIVPRSETCLLGGTFVVRVETTVPDPAVTERIVERCARLDRRLLGAKILGVRVGIRPCRPTVRLEAELLAPGKTVIHNYGHGGAGVTLSWGCAHDVVELVRGL